MTQTVVNNKKKDIVIVTCFAANEPRVEYVQNYFKKNEKSTIVISTDFIHRGKYFRKEIPEGYHLIKTQPYKKNLSIGRLSSHYKFSKSAMDVVEEYKPELLYVMLPANSLAKFAAKYKRQNKCKLVLDIIDLWPESLPIPVEKSIWPLSIWSNFRDKNLVFADAILTECNLYQEKLHLERLNTPTYTVYWPQEDYGDISEISQEQEKIKFFYLGSINNIIDIDGMVKFLCGVQKFCQVELHIIGDGEKRQRLLDLLQEKKIPTKFYGYLYEHEQIYQIASKCHMALNMMKKSVQIGLTMKSVSYFEMGLPVVNNLKGDTWELLEQYHAGINLADQNIEQWMLNHQQLVNMGKQARRMFEELFSQKAFEKQIARAMQSTFTFEGF